MITDDGPKVLEYNARLGDPETEVILPRVTSDMADVLLAAARGALDRFLPLEVKNEACVGIVLASGGYPGNHERGKTITGLADAARMPGIELFHAGTARDGDRLVTSGGRVLVVTATAASMTEAAVRAYEAADRIQFEGKHIRRDIAAGGVRPSRI
jgi:phosphoribosylamine--glycine ligase